MSVCKNTANRFILPLFNKICRHKTNISVLNIKTPTKYITKNNSYVNSRNLHNQFRNLSTTNNLHKIISFNLSDIGEGIREVVVKEWYIKEGDHVSQFDNICEVQSDKASVTITSRYDGIIKKIHHKVDDIALVGKALVDIETEELEDNSDKTTPPAESVETKESPKTVEQTIKIDVQIEDGSSRGFAIPSVRRIAKENQINLMNVKGTGKDGRVLKEDILKYLENKSIVKVTTQNDTKIEPIRGYVRTMIKTMEAAKKIPHFVLHEEINVSNLVTLRAKLKNKTLENNLKITYLPFFIKATSNALKRYPILNARLDDNGENILYYNYHNIGIAMDTPGGLAVPVIKNVEDKTIVDICKELVRLQNLGKQMKFSPDDLSDGTFSFSNIGAIGGTYANPIILPPQSAIIALGKFQQLPRIISNSTEYSIESVGYMSGAADHRIIDGATMARFFNVIKQQIEEPDFLFMDI